MCDGTVTRTNTLNRAHVLTAPFITKNRPHSQRTPKGAGALPATGKNVASVSNREARRPGTREAFCDAHGGAPTHIWQRPRLSVYP